MKYYLDQEFQEGFHKPLFGKRRHFIDLISIGIVSEDGRSFYAISNEFDLDSVWKDEWLRDNVLRPIHKHFISKESQYAKNMHGNLFLGFTKRSLKTLIRWHGQCNKEIELGVIAFVNKSATPPVFYGYYCDYDWVLFCSLFGKMIQLPHRFPMYCRDLKQTVDELNVEKYFYSKDVSSFIGPARENGLGSHERVTYPSESSGHDALEDAKWIKGLHEFLESNYIK